MYRGLHGHHNKCCLQSCCSASRTHSLGPSGGRLNLPCSAHLGVNDQEMAPYDIDDLAPPCSLPCRALCMLFPRVDLSATAARTEGRSR